MTREEAKDDCHHVCAHIFSGLFNGIVSESEAEANPICAIGTISGANDVDADEFMTEWFTVLLDERGDPPPPVDDEGLLLLSEVMVIAKYRPAFF